MDNINPNYRTPSDISQAQAAQRQQAQSVSGAKTPFEQVQDAKEAAARFEQALKDIESSNASHYQKAADYQKLAKDIGSEISSLSKSGGSVEQIGRLLKLNQRATDGYKNESAYFEHALKDLESSTTSLEVRKANYKQFINDIGKEIDSLLQSSPVDNEKVSQLLALQGKATHDYYLLNQLSDVIPTMPDIDMPSKPRPPKSEIDKPFGMR